MRHEGIGCLEGDDLAAVFALPSAIRLCFAVSDVGTERTATPANDLDLTVFAYPTVSLVRPHRSILG